MSLVALGGQKRISNTMLGLPHSWYQIICSGFSKAVVSTFLRLQPFIHSFSCGDPQPWKYFHCYVITLICCNELQCKYLCFLMVLGDPCERAIWQTSLKRDIDPQVENYCCRGTDLIEFAREWRSVGGEVRKNMRVCVHVFVHACVRACKGDILEWLTSCTPAIPTVAV